MSELVSNELIFVPLGGAGEIGMNLNLYSYKGHWLIVDLGITFADSAYPGVDIVLPDPSFIVERRKHLLGIVLTHAHEDHVGAIPYLWERLECPIYATSYTAALVQRKLEHVGLDAECDIHRISYRKPFELGPFEITYINITHSIPESSALLIRTDVGSVVHSGDWKLDPEPLVGKTTDELFFREVGKSGVDALICDSTNVFRQGESGSEAEVLDSLKSLMADRPGRIVVSTFASNIARIRSIALLAQGLERQIALIGRSLWQSVELARACGYLTDLPQILNESEASDVPPGKIVLLCTGCQGEPNGAMSRIAFEHHPRIKLAHGDVVIMSSKIIPGNERSIGRMLNQLVLKGIEVITERDALVHVSGHPSRDELQRLYGWLTPKALVPVHGEAIHISQHARYAKSLGIATTVVARNGDVVRLAPKPAAIIDHVLAGRLVVNANEIVAHDADLIRSRRRLMHNGIVIITILVDKGTRIMEVPVVRAIGVVASYEELEHEIETSLIKIALPAGSDRGSLDTAARQAVNRVLRNLSGKRPILHISILSADENTDYQYASERGLES